MHCHDICYPCFVEGKKKRSFSCSAKNTKPPSCSHSPALCLCALPRLLWGHPSFLAIVCFSPCTCPQRPIWKQTPPIYNSIFFMFICHRVRTVLHSWPLPCQQSLPTFHAHKDKSFRKFPALTTNWLQLAQKDNERKSKVKVKEKERNRRERTDEGNSRVGKPTGFRWISSDEKIFHSLWA